MNEQRRPLIVGEVLFDVMPDGRRVLGGAPFNVAWHLEAFGLRPLMITRVGADESGDEVLAAMQAWGMDISGVQRDDLYPTGRVEVELQDGEPTFHILADQAYDHVESNWAVRSLSGESFSILYHGSLISREDVSGGTLVDLARASGAPVFVDVNLRDPWWNHEDVLAFVGGATWVKLNEAELDLLAGASDLRAAQAFRAEHGLEAVIVTKGSRGAVTVDDHGVFEVPAPEGIRVVDTVGAGDAFSAVFILGLARNWSMELALGRAVEFAAALCTVSGATVRDREFYSRFSDGGW